MLKVENLHCAYGNLEVVHGVQLQVSEGEIVTIIGANGAGKSTLLKTISGLLSPMQGRIYFQDQDITGLSANRIVRSGLCHVPEGRKIFAELTVLDNLELGGYAWRRASSRTSQATSLAFIFDLFPRLKERCHQRAGTLSGGEQQMLAIGRALMSQPKLLVLDEPSLGLAPLVRRMILEVIQGLHQRGISILLVEQNARAALNIAHRAYVMETGRMVMEGVAKELLELEAVRHSYLGTE